MKIRYAARRLLVSFLCVFMAFLLLAASFSVTAAAGGAVDGAAAARNEKQPDCEQLSAAAADGKFFDFFCGKV